VTGDGAGLVDVGLNVFHGVRSTMDGNPYVLGVALHDLDDPRRVRMSSIPVLFPSPADCRTPEDAYVHVPHVVFCCGMLHRADGTVVIYHAGKTPSSTSGSATKMSWQSCASATARTR
jgi:predicted GH43/DUF377 family glycosyl hydrolase